MLGGKRIRRQQDDDVGALEDARHSAGAGKKRNQQSDANDAERQRMAMESIMKQHYETKFTPLHASKINETIAVVEPESEWEGLSLDENDDFGVAEVDGSDSSALIVDYARSSSREVAETLTATDYKSFMSSKPPTSASNSIDKEDKSRKGKSGHQEGEGEDASTEAQNVKHDAALQRLLRESHLLDNDSLSTTGKSRHVARELQLGTMGSKSSIFKQQNMPIGQRRGIAAKATERENKRRQEAKENGIILEKRAKTGLQGEREKRRREIDVARPSVGQMRGGMLSLSRKDVREIEGHRSSASRERAGGARGRGRGGGRGRGK